jgi:HD domain
MAPTQFLLEAKALEPRLKSALYSCFERVQATKAALYLASANNADDQRFSLVTSYGYTDAGRDAVDARDAVVDALLKIKKPVIVNELASAGRLSEVMFRQQNERLMVIPIFGRGRRMIGFIDCRDKAAKKPFDHHDAAEGDAVAQSILRLLGEKKLYHVGPLSIIAMPKPEPLAEARPLAMPSRPRAVVADEPLSQRAQDAIRIARERAERRGIAFEPRKRILSRQEIERVAAFLPAALAIPGALACGISTIARGTPQVFAATGELSTDAMTMLRMQIAGWMKRSVSVARQPLVSYTGAGKTITASRMKAIANAAVAPRAAEGLVLTVAFDGPPDAAAKEQFTRFVEVFGDAMSAIIGHNEYLSQRYAIAERLLEPDFQKYPGLSDHCRHVAGLAERFATALRLGAQTVETVRVAALVHDVGLRLLDYELIASKAALPPAHVEALHEHPLIGATLVEPILGGDVAEIVLRHHERWDGGGYPGRVAGERVPLPARLIAIADAWAAMTSPWSYPSEVPPGDAAARLRAEAGKQFDPKLVEAFLANLEKIA